MTVSNLSISAVDIISAIAYVSDKKDVADIPCIKLTLSDGATFLGDSILPEHASSIQNKSQILEALQSLLKDQPLADYLSQCRSISQVSYRVPEYKLPDPAEATAEEMQKRNRREILSVMGLVDQIQPEPILTDVDYPLPNQIIRGTSAALLQAFAHQAKLSIFEFVSSMVGKDLGQNQSLRYGLDVNLAGKSAFLPHTAAVCYTLPVGAGAESLGKSVEKLQKYLRELNGWIEATWAKREPAERPWLFVDLNGSTHQINNQVMGKTLGTLYGFSTTGFQDKMIFANPVIRETAAKTMGDMSLLGSLLQSRKLRLRAAPAVWLNGTENLRGWLKTSKVDLLVIDLDHVASVGELIEMIKAVLSTNFDFILRGSSHGNERTWGMMHALAQAADPLFYLPSGGEQGLIQAVNQVN